MERKEIYRRNLPHFQQPGQAYMVTVSLKDAAPPKAFKQYSLQLTALKHKITCAKKEASNASFLQELEKEYALLRKKYIKAYDDLLALNDKTEIDLTIPENLSILFSAFRYYEGKRLESFAYCVMRNHFHWVFQLYKNDERQKPVYLQDIMQVVKGFSAHQINEREQKTGRTVWLSESFDTTIRNDKHLYNAIKYTINNPVKAGLKTNWQDWEGAWCHRDFIGLAGIPACDK